MSLLVGVMNLAQLNREYRNNGYDRRDRREVLLSAIATNLNRNVVGGRYYAYNAETWKEQMQFNKARAQLTLASRMPYNSPGRNVALAALAEANQQPSAAFIRAAGAFGMEYERAILCLHWDFRESLCRVFGRGGYTTGTVCHKCGADRATFNLLAGMDRGVVRVGEVGYRRISADTITIRGYKDFVDATTEQPAVIFDTNTRADVWKYKDKDVVGTMPIRGYHSARNNGYALLPGPEPAHGELTFGMEIETNVVDYATNRPRRATELLLDYPEEIDVEMDGSVERGFEIVTGYGAYPSVRKLLGDLYNSHLSDTARFRFTNGTGIHIHVGRWGPKIRAADCVAAIDFIARYPVLNEVISGREATRYCYRLVWPQHAVADFNHACYLVENPRDNGYTRYFAVNFMRLYDGERTIEWRSPRGTNGFSTALARLQFIRSLMLLSREFAADRRRIQVEDFADQIAALPAEDTAALRRLLSTTGVAAELRLRERPEVVSLLRLPYNRRAEYVFCQR